MNRATENKIILVTRPTRLDELVHRFNTVEQARFYVEHLGADFSDYLREDETYRHALSATETALNLLGRVQVVARSFLPNFIFGPQDTVVVLGQDGLVANTLKYLDGQPVLGVNPDPKRWDGQLLPFKTKDLAKVMPEVFRKARRTRAVTMAQATLNNGQSLCAVNDLFIGPRSHGSARYRLQSGGEEERQSSSGIIVSTGLGSTGWFKSLLTGASAVSAAATRAINKQGGLADPVEWDEPVPQIWQSNTSEADNGAATRQRTQKRAAPADSMSFPWDARHLYFTVREPFPTSTTGASLVFGQITKASPLVIVSEMAENGVIFSDGIEKDFLEFNSGTRAEITLSPRQGCLVE